MVKQTISLHKFTITAICSECGEFSTEVNKNNITTNEDYGCAVIMVACPTCKFISAVWVS